jgi:hypothetical protein
MAERDTTTHSGCSHWYAVFPDPGIGDERFIALLRDPYGQSPATRQADER